MTKKEKALKDIKEYTPKEKLKNFLKYYKNSNKEIRKNIRNLNLGNFIKKLFAN